MANNFFQTSKLGFMDCMHLAQNYHEKCLGLNKSSYLFKIIFMSRIKIIFFWFNMHGVRFYIINYFIWWLQAWKKTIQNRQYFVWKVMLFI